MSSSEGGKSKKKDRMRKWCAAYRANGRREINKAKRLMRHIRKFPLDLNAAKMLAAMNSIHRARAVKEYEEAKARTTLLRRAS